MRKFHENTTNYPELSVMPNFSHLTTTHHQDTIMASDSMLGTVCVLQIKFKAVYTLQ